MESLANAVIIRSKRRRLGLQIDREGRVIVRAPIDCSNAYIEHFLREQAGWITKHLEAIKDTPPIKKQYVDGETFLYLGKPYTLIIGSYKGIKIVGDQLQFPLASTFRAQKELTAWYRTEAKRVITIHVDKLAKQMQTTYGTLHFSDTISKWGSCSKENNLQFNWRLILAPMMVINYVVIHELAHTLQHNHSQAFWKIVATYNPSYKQQIKWLKQHGHELQGSM